MKSLRDKKLMITKFTKTSSPKENYCGMYYSEDVEEAITQFKAELYDFLVDEFGMDKEKLYIMKKYKKRFEE